MVLTESFAQRCCLVGLVFVSAAHSVSAISLSDGSTAFNSPPTLVGAVTTNNSVYAWRATYYFTLKVPENAGEPLHHLTITQTEGFDRNLSFDLKRSHAFEGVSYRKKNPPIALGDVTYDPEREQIKVVFDPPVAPGKTVTVGLEPYQNPSTSGIYLFDVTVYPPGDKPRGQFIGFGRLTFYRSGFW